MAERTPEQLEVFIDRYLSEQNVTLDETKREMLTGFLHGQSYAWPSRGDDELEPVYQLAEKIAEAWATDVGPRADQESE